MIISQPLLTDRLELVALSTEYVAVNHWIAFEKNLELEAITRPGPSGFLG